MGTTKWQNKKAISSTQNKTTYESICLKEIIAASSAKRFYKQSFPSPVT